MCDVIFARKQNDHGQLYPPPLTAKAMSAAANPTPWKDSKAKDVLMKDILSGFVPDSMTAKEVYNDKRDGRHLLYTAYDFKNFATNLRNLRKLLRTQDVLAAECQANLDRELLLYPPSDADPRGYPRWDKSNASASLKRDIDAMLAGTLTATSSQLYASNPEYRVFPLRVFIDHVNQEKKSRRQSAYWINFKNEQQEKKLLQRQQRQQRQNHSSR
jgi:hypothetical protein